MEDREKDGSVGKWGDSRSDVSRKAELRDGVDDGLGWDLFLFCVVNLIYCKL